MPGLPVHPGINKDTSNEMPIGKITKVLTEGILKQYGQLEKLNLSKNEISEIEDASGLSGLTKLNLSDNLLTEVQLGKLVVLSKLRELNLANNKITLLDSFPRFPVLQNFDISNNRIADAIQISFLKETNPQLTELNISGNPFGSLSMSIASAFVYLVKLNGSPFIPPISSTPSPSGKQQHLLLQTPRVDISFTTPEVSPRQNPTSEAPRLFNTSSRDGFPRGTSLTDKQSTPVVSLQTFFPLDNTDVCRQDPCTSFTKQQRPSGDGESEIKSSFEGNNSPWMFLQNRQRNAGTQFGDQHDDDPNACQDLFLDGSDNSFSESPSSLEYSASTSHLLLHNSPKAPELGGMQHYSEIQPQKNSPMASFPEYFSQSDHSHTPSPVFRGFNAGVSQSSRSSHFKQSGASVVQSPGFREGEYDEGQNVSYFQSNQAYPTRTPSQNAPDSFLTPNQLHMMKAKKMNQQQADPLSKNKSNTAQPQTGYNARDQHQPYVYTSQIPAFSSPGRKKNKSQGLESDPKMRIQQYQDTVCAEPAVLNYPRSSGENFKLQIPKTSNESYTKDASSLPVSRLQGSFFDETAIAQTHHLAPNRSGIDKHQLLALEQQASALKKALQLQEEAIGQEAQAEEAERPGSTVHPRGWQFATLLELWRNQVVKLLVQAESTKIAHHAEVEKLQSQLEQQVSEKQQLGKMLQIQHAKLEGLEAELDVARSKLQQQSARLVELVQHCQRLEHQVSEEVQGRLAMERVVDAFQAVQGQEQNMIDAYFLQAMVKVEEYDQRLSLLLGRLVMLSTLMERKEVNLRNRQAALVADRRVWVKERAKQEEKALVELFERAALQAATKGENRTADSMLDRISENKNLFEGISRKASHTNSLLHKGLRPECEAVMRAVFCRLDRLGKGKVEVQTLLAVLREDETIFHVMSRWAGGRAQWVGVVDELEEELMASQEDTSHASLIDITWGEFLLFFVPLPENFLQEDQEKKLVAKERDMCQSQSEEDAMALLQLNIPQGWLERYERLTKSKHSLSIVGSGGSLEALPTSQLKKETRRLARERWYLVELLKEEVKRKRFRENEAGYCFRKQLALIQTKVNDLEWECRDLRDQKSVLLEKEKLSAMEAEEGRHHLQVMCQNWEQQKTELEEAHDKMLANIEGKRQEELESLNLKLLRLETELGVVRREQSKSLVRERTLERELARIKQAQREEESMLVRDLQDRISSREAEISTVRRERNALLAALRDTQRQPGKGTEKEVQKDQVSADAESKQNSVQEVQMKLPSKVEESKRKDWSGTDPVRSRLNDLSALTQILLQEDGDLNDSDNDQKAL